MSCTIIHNETGRYPYNSIYKTVLVEAITYPKIKVLTLILLDKMKRVKPSSIIKFPLYHAIYLVYRAIASIHLNCSESLDPTMV